MIPKNGDLFEVSFTNKEGKIVFNGYVLAKEEEGSPKTFRMYAFIYDPDKITKELVDKYGSLTMNYKMIPYTGLFMCPKCNASYSSSECLAEHYCEH